MRRSALILVWAATLLLLVPAAAEALTLDQAVDKLFQDGYPQRLEDTIAGFKSVPLGFRWTGSDADDRAARFIADEMKADGLTDVKLEPVPVDAWTTGEASVTVGSRVLAASSFPGVPPTGVDGVTGQVVRIPGPASAADFDRAGDLTGKIALIDFAPEYWWFDFPCAEAGLRGAAAVIMIYDAAYPGFQGAPGAFASNDSRYTSSSPPLVWLPSRSASWLQKQIAKGPTRATVKLTSTYTLAEGGGVGYNVIGSLPGSSAAGTKIVLGGHHDAHFTGALDGTSSCVAQLVMAKAMQMTGYEASSTVVFFSTTAEEWGYTDSTYDRLVGATYSIQHTHPDWAGSVKAMLDLETLGYRDGSLWFTASRDLKPWLEAEIKAHPELAGPKGGVVYTPDQSSWFSANDQWPLTAVGIPSACMWTADNRYWADLYHTDLDTADLLDWDFLKQNIELDLELTQSLDGGLLPYHLSSEATALAAASRLAGFTAAGVDSTATADYLTATREYLRAAKAFDSAHGRVDSSEEATVNAGLLATEKELGSDLTGLDAWDATVYPFQQSMVDLTGMRAAVAALGGTSPRYGAALTALQGVGWTWYGTHFSYPVYADDLWLRRPDYAHAGIAALGHMALQVDVVPEYNAVVKARAGKTVPKEAITGLKAKIAAEQADIAERLQDLSSMLGDVVAQIRAVTPDVGPERDGSRHGSRHGPRRLGRTSAADPPVARRAHAGG